MTNVQPNTTASATAQKILAKDIHAKWEKISDQEAAGMKSTGDIVAMVQSKYSLNQEQAQKAVDTWTNGRSF